MGRVSVMFPTYVAISRAFGRGVVVGDGSNVAATVRIETFVATALMGGCRCTWTTSSRSSCSFSSAP